MLCQPSPSERRVRRTVWTELPRHLKARVLGHCHTQALTAVCTVSKDMLAVLDEPAAWAVAVEDVDPFYHIGPKLMLAAARHHRGAWRGLMADLSRHGGCWVVHPPEDAPLDSPPPRFSVRAATHDQGATADSALTLVRGITSKVKTSPVLHLNRRVFLGAPSIMVSSAVDLLAALRTRGLVNILITRSIDCRSICVEPVQMRHGADTYPLKLPEWCAPRLVGVIDPSCGHRPELLVPRGGVVIESDLACFEDLRIVSGTPPCPVPDCAICLGTSRRGGPQMVGCGHVFCRSCVTKHAATLQRQGQSVCCPECRYSLPKAEVEALLLDNDEPKDEEPDYDPAYPAIDVDTCASVLIDGVEIVSRVGTAIMNNGQVHVVDTSLRFELLGIVNSTGARSTLRGCSLSGGVWGVAGGVIDEDSRAALLDANIFGKNIEEEPISDIFKGHEGIKYQLWRKGWLSASTP